MSEYIIKLNNALYDPDTGAAVFKPEFIGELIRCKDCRNNDHEFCYVHEFRTPDLGYCHFAERKKDEKHV